MKSIKKIEETQLIGKQESPEIEPFSDIEEEDTEATFRNTLQDEVTQNIKTEDPLSNEENWRNQLAMSDPSNIWTKGEDEEELYVAKALLQDREIAPFLGDEESAQSQAEEQVADMQEQPNSTDKQQQPVKTDIQETPLPVGTQEQQDPEDTQEQQEPADTQEQSAPADAQQQTVQTDVQEIPMPLDTPQQPVPMEIDNLDGNVANADLEREIIKEEIEENKPPEEQPIVKDYYYRCRSCNQVLDNLRGLVEHRMAQHNIRPRRHLFTHLDLEPIVDDPDHYCRSCDLYFISRMRYRDHLENAHHMILLKPLRTPKYVINGDPNLYCVPCDKQMKNKYMHRYHLEKHHNVKLPPFKRKVNPDITPDLDNPDSYCASCNYKFKNRGVFKTHCINIHKMQVPKKSRVIKEGTPDLNDPNSYCTVCEHTFASRQKFKRHCRNVHKMDDPSLLPASLARVSPPKFFCKTCDMPLYKDSFYLRHLSLAHTVEVISLHHDEDDTGSKADIIELIHTRKAQVDQSELPKDQPRPQTVTIDIESANTEATASKNPESIKNNDATSRETRTKSVNTPNEPMQLRPRTRQHVHFADLPTKMDDTPTGYDDSQSESDDYSPDLRPRQDH